jgi:hypothetical protein
MGNLEKKLDMLTAPVCSCNQKSPINLSYFTVQPSGFCRWENTSEEPGLTFSSPHGPKPVG